MTGDVNISKGFSYLQNIRTKLRHWEVTEERNDVPLAWKPTGYRPEGE
jgi:hypothetical protein